MGDLVPLQHMYQEFILKMHWGGITISKGLLIITVSGNYSPKWLF